MERDYKEEILEQLATKIVDKVHVNRDIVEIEKSIGDITRFYIKTSILFSDDLERLDELMMKSYQSIRRRERRNEFIVSYIDSYKKVE